MGGLLVFAKEIEMDERINKAVIKYLNMTEHEVIDPNFKNYIVTADKEGVAFCNVFTVTDGERIGTDITRDEFENIMFDWFADADDDVTDVRVRYDIIEVHVIGKSRAIIKHYINADQNLER